MIGVVATLTIQDGKQAEFETAMKKMQDDVKANEPECSLYQCHKTEDATVYVILESYGSQDALDAHGKSDHYKAFGRVVVNLLGGAPDVKIYQTI